MRPHKLGYAAAGVVHPKTKRTLTKFRELAKDPDMREVWTTAFGKEIGSLAQGDNKTHTPGTNTVFFMSKAELFKIPRD